MTIYYSHIVARRNGGCGQHLTVNQCHSKADAISSAKLYAKANPEYSYVIFEAREVIKYNLPKPPDEFTVTPVETE
jgi:hypothetical protein